MSAVRIVTLAPTSAPIPLATLGLTARRRSWPATSSSAARNVPPTASIVALGDYSSRPSRRASPFGSRMARSSPSNHPVTDDAPEFDRR